MRPNSTASTHASDAPAERLWKRFGEMWGARFYEQFGERPNESWIDGTSDLSTHQIREALTRIRNSGAAHPTSLPEFRAIARGVVMPPAANVPRYSPEALASRARRMAAVNSIRATMPKDRHGHIVDPQYVPERDRADYLARWDGWNAANPGVLDAYGREASLLLTGRAA